MFVRRLAASILAVICALTIATDAHAQSKRYLTLTGALQRALESNPRLTAAERDIGMAARRKLQASAIPNPEISFETDNIFGTGPYRGTGAAEYTLQLSQLIELGGKRTARVAAGSAELEAYRWQREAVRLEILSDTADRYLRCTTRSSAAFNASSATACGCGCISALGSCASADRSRLGPGRTRARSRYARNRAA